MQCIVIFAKHSLHNIIPSVFYACWPVHMHVIYLFPYLLCLCNLGSIGLFLNILFYAFYSKHLFIYFSFNASKISISFNSYLHLIIWISYNSYLHIILWISFYGSHLIHIFISSYASIHTSTYIHLFQFIVLYFIHVNYC